MRSEMYLKDSFVKINRFKLFLILKQKNPLISLFKKILKFFKVNAYKSCSLNTTTVHMCSQRLSLNNIKNVTIIQTTTQIYLNFSSNQIT